DPNISVQGAIVQIDRIAKIRDLDYDKVNELIQNQIEKPLLEGLGPNKINVLKLNIELDKLSK
ncbi:MAG: potassium-transporting ATPase subunit C, partial [Algoriella sp.]